MEVLERVPHRVGGRVGRRKLFVTEAGAGDPVVLLHGGGPGATGVELLAQHRRARRPVPGHRPGPAGLRAVVEGIDHSDPFGDLAFAIRGLLDELGIEKAHLVGNSYGGAAALRLALDRPDKVDRLILMGPAGSTTRALPTKGLNALFDYYGGDGPSREARHVHPRLPGVRRRGGARRAHRPPLRGQHPARGVADPPATPVPCCPAHPAAHGLHARPTAGPPAHAHPRHLGRTTR